MGGGSGRPTWWRFLTACWFTWFSGYTCRHWLYWTGNNWCACVWVDVRYRVRTYRPFVCERVGQGFLMWICETGCELVTLECISNDGTIYDVHVYLYTSTLSGELIRSTEIVRGGGGVTSIRNFSLPKRHFNRTSKPTEAMLSTLTLVSVIDYITFSSNSGAV